MRHLAIVLAVLVLAAPALAADSIDTILNQSGPVEADPNQPVWNPAPDMIVLYENGPLFTNANACSAPSPNDSRLQPVPAEGTFGVNVNTAAITPGYRVAEDFTIPQGQCWDIQAITFFAYQTGATAPSITNVTFQIRAGVPPGGAIIYGDETTNVLAGPIFSGTQRSQTVGCGANRHIQALNAICVVGPLPAGTYWVDYGTLGSLASGPWAPLISNVGGGASGNAMQRISGGVWTNIIDAPPGDGLTKGVPFVLQGVNCGATAVEPTTWGTIKNLY